MIREEEHLSNELAKPAKTAARLLVYEVSRVVSKMVAPSSGGFLSTVQKNVTDGYQAQGVIWLRQVVSELERLRQEAP